MILQKERQAKEGFDKDSIAGGDGGNKERARLPLMKIQK